MSEEQRDFELTVDTVRCKSNVDRRGFLKAAVGLGAAAAVTSMLPGCAPTSKQEMSTRGKTTNQVVASQASWLGEAPEIKDSEITQTVEVDVVVVGGGNAGTMCACAAAEEDTTVAVIEPQSKEGITYYGLHDIASINSQFVLSSGIQEINKSEFIAEYQRRTHNRSNPRLIKKFVDNSGDMLDWLLAKAPQEVRESAHIENLNSNNDYIEMGSQINNFKCWKGCVQVDFQTTAPVLIAEAESKGATWYWKHTGVVLIAEEDEVSVQTEKTNLDGTIEKITASETRTKVSGVIAKDAEGKYIKFTGKKGVVLACGDYGGNHEMYFALQDEQRWLYESHGLDASNLKCAGFGRDGSGIKMGMWAGATMDPGPRCLVAPQVMFESSDFASNVLRWGAGFDAAASSVAAGAGGANQNPWGCPFVCLDSSGKRFTDETFMGIFGTMQRVERRKPGKYYFFFDNKWADLMSRAAPEHFSQPVGISDSIDYNALFSAWVDRGAEGAPTEKGGTVCAWAAHSLDELFEYMGFDEDLKKAAKNELTIYNHYCGKGEDEDFGRDPKMLLPVSEPPFFGMYSVEEKPMVGTVTLNGLVIDDEQRVLDSNYNAISNLYASGNNSGGRFAVEYSTPMSGLTLGLAMTLGRLLGKQLAKGELKA